MTRVLLAGGGHTHLIAGPLLVARLGRGAQVTLLAPAPRLLYSGMMPGWLAGQYRFEDCSIDLRRVAADAGLAWEEDTLVDVDFAAREAIGAGGRRHVYDLLSLNVGSANLPGDIAPGSTVRVLGAKPFADFVAGWKHWIAQPPAAARCVVIGGGAAAFEIACALAAQCRAGGRLAGGSVALASTGDRLLSGLSGIAAALAGRSLRERGVSMHLGVRYTGVRGDRVLLRADTGAEVELPADLAIVANGARPPAWLTASARRAGVPVQPDGGVAVDACMQAVGDGRVFASGDCASFTGALVPKSGVHALRQGAPLAASIALRAEGSAGFARRPDGGPADAARLPCTDPGSRYVPQPRSLALLNRCDGTAIAAWGPLGAAGAAWWRLKDGIDQRFVDRFRAHHDGGAV